HSYRIDPGHGPRGRGSRAIDARGRGETRAKPAPGCDVSVHSSRTKIHASRLSHFRSWFSVAGFRSRQTDGVRHHPAVDHAGGVAEFWSDLDPGKTAAKIQGRGVLI